MHASTAGWPPLKAAPWTGDWEPLGPGGRAVHIVDAKYKAHLAELDEAGWRSFIDEQPAAHRADLHQVLAYASLYDAQAIRATLVYPLRLVTWPALFTNAARSFTTRRPSTLLRAVSTPRAARCSRPRPGQP